MSTFFLIWKHTVRDLFRERILYNALFVGVFLLFFGYLAALLVFGHQDRVMLHFGTLVNALCLYVVGISAGSRSIRSEIENRNLTLILVRPLSRTKLLFSRWAGIAGFVGLNALLLVLVLTLGIYLTGGSVQLEFFQSFSLIWVEAAMITAFALMISMMLKPGLNAMISLSFLFISHNHDQLDFLQNQNEGPKGLFKVLEHLTPDGSLFLMDTRVYYHQPLAPMEWLHRGAFGLFWGLTFLLFANALFYRKNI